MSKKNIENIELQKYCKVQEVGGNTTPRPIEPCDEKKIFKKKNVPVRRWCFTFFDESGQKQPGLVPGIKWIESQWEKCPETGAMHWQGRLMLDRRQCLSTIKAFGGCFATMHLEQERGSSKQSSDYCKKSKTSVAGTYKGEGKKDAPGTRSDLIAFRDAIKNGMTEFECMESEEFFPIWCRNPQLYGRIKQKYMSKVKKGKPHVMVFVGSPGCGKSRMAHEIGSFYKDDLYCLTGNFKWFEDYENEKCLVLEDYDGQLQLKCLLQLLDRYKFKGEVKHGTCYITSPIIIITCNDLCWINHEAIRRRIDVIYNFDERKPLIADVLCQIGLPAITSDLAVGVVNVVEPCGLVTTKVDLC